MAIMDLLASLCCAEVQCNPWHPQRIPISHYVRLNFKNNLVKLPLNEFQSAVFCLELFLGAAPKKLLEYELSLYIYIAQDVEFCFLWDCTSVNMTGVSGRDNFMENSCT